MSRDARDNLKDILGSLELEDEIDNDEEVINSIEDIRENENFEPIYSEQKSKSKKYIWIVGVVLVIVALATLFSLFDNNDNSYSSSIIETDIKPKSLDSYMNLFIYKTSSELIISKTDYISGYVLIDEEENFTVFVKFNKKDSDYNVVVSNGNDYNLTNKSSYDNPIKYMRDHEYVNSDKKEFQSYQLNMDDISKWYDEGYITYDKS